MSLLKKHILNIVIILLCIINLVSNIFWDNLKISGICGILVGILGFMNIAASKKNNKDKKE